LAQHCVGDENLCHRKPASGHPEQLGIG
jgi:hypothetical protein